MDLGQVIALIAAVITIIAFLFGFFRNLKIDIKADINRLDTDMKGWTQHLTAMQAEQSKRTDKLHEMFYELLKEVRK